MTVCLINGKKYIGKYEGAESDEYLGSGKLLLRAIKKHGKQSFTRVILKRCASKAETRQSEKELIELYGAVENKDFYNICKGGEGGDTFSGMNKLSYSILKAKLKLRKGSGKYIRGEKRIACFDLNQNTKYAVDKESFYAKSTLVGVSCKGIYLTPFGNFANSASAKKHIQADTGTVIKRCKNNRETITLKHMQNLPYNSNIYKNIYSNLGKTFEEAGYCFLPVNTISNKPIDFYEKLNIIK